MRSSSLEIEIVDDRPQHKKPRLSLPASSSPEPSRAAASAAPSADVDGLFFFDDAPKAVKKKAAWLSEDDSTPPTPAGESATDGTAADTLVLPSHIIVEGEPLAAGEDANLVEEGGERPLTEAEVFADDLGKIEFLDGGDDKPVRLGTRLLHDVLPADARAYGNRSSATST